MEIKITTPLTREKTKDLKAGDTVYITGTIFTGRDAAHKRLIDLLDQGENLPVDLTGQIIYYVGPTPEKPGQAIGSAGPTTSGRMDLYTPKLLDLGMKGMIGKGARNKDVVDAIVRNGAVYFAATGGAAALIAKCVKSSEIVAYEDLGAEAIRRLEVEDMPVVVVIDSEGNNLYEIGQKNYLDSVSK